MGELRGPGFAYNAVKETYGLLPSLGPLFMVHQLWLGCFGDLVVGTSGSLSCSSSPSEWLTNGWLTKVVSSLTWLGSQFLCFKTYTLLEQQCFFVRVAFFQALSFDVRKKKVTPAMCPRVLVQSHHRLGSKRWKGTLRPHAPLCQPPMFTFTFLHYCSFPSSGLYYPLFCTGVKAMLRG